MSDPDSVEVHVDLETMADSEPPRVRALLGALAEELERYPAARARLRASLNPLSRFDFGQFTALTHARKWQAKA